MEDITPYFLYKSTLFKSSLLSTFRAYSGTLLASVWIQFKYSPIADICASFSSVFSQAKLHWLWERFCLSKNIRFDLSIAQWQLITVQNRFLFFFFNKIQKNLQPVCLLPLKLSSLKNNRNNLFFPKLLQHPLKNLNRVQKLINQHLWEPNLATNSAAQSEVSFCHTSKGK